MPTNALVVAILLAVVSAVGCEPAPLPGPPVVLLSTTATFVGDGYQHGPAGSPVADVARDAAHPAVLPDGNLLHVYADTATLPGVEPSWFFSSSAVLSPSGSATHTVEALRDGHPMQLLPWTPAETAAVVPGQRYIGVWPTGATWIPADVDGGNRVLITYQRVRVDLTTSPATFTLLGQGVAEHRYTTSERALVDGIVATRLNDDVFPRRTYPWLEVMGSPVYRFGWVYLYGCGASITCVSARVRPAQIADPAAWQWFDGTAYVATSPYDRAPLAGVGEFSLASVQWVAAHKAYAFTSSRGNATIAVRWASSPAGPWTAAQEITLPGCSGTLPDGGCFGAVTHPASTTTSLVFTYARYGEYRTRVASVPVRAA